MLVDLAAANIEGPLYFWPFGGNMRLAEVIVGPRCDRKLSDLRSLVARSKSGAIVFKARLAFRSFRVVLDERTRPSLRKVVSHGMQRS